MLLPLCTVEQIRAELDEIDGQLDSMGAHLRIVDPDQAAARRERLNRWRQRLAEQVAEMEQPA